MKEQGSARLFSYSHLKVGLDFASLVHFACLFEVLAKSSSLILAVEVRKVSLKL